jgi:hypothetical protein
MQRFIKEVLYDREVIYTLYVLKQSESQDGYYTRDRRKPIKQCLRM